MTPLTADEVIANVETWLWEIERDKYIALFGPMLSEPIYQPVDGNGETADDRSHRDGQPLQPANEDDEDDDPAEDSDGA